MGSVTVLHLEVLRKTWKNSPLPPPKKNKPHVFMYNKNTKVCQQQKAKDVRGADFHIRE